MKEAVARYIGDAKARELADATIQKLSHIFVGQLLEFCEQEEIKFLRDLDARNLSA